MVEQKKHNMKKLFALIISIAIFIPSVSSAAIAFDATSEAHDTSGTVSSLTFSHTTSGTNRILFVGFFAGVTDIITGVTYAGTAMTLVNKIQAPGGRWAYLYRLVAPASGANNIVISASGNTAFGAAGASYTGAAQTGQPDASSTNTTSASTSFTESVTTVANNAWTVLSLRDENGSALTAGGGTTIRQNAAVGYSFSDSNGPKTPAGSTSLSVSMTPSTNWGGVMASIVPFQEAPATTTSAMQVLWFDE